MGLEGSDQEAKEEEWRRQKLEEVRRERAEREVRGPGPGQGSGSGSGVGLGGPRTY